MWTRCWPSKGSYFVGHRSQGQLGLMLGRPSEVPVNRWGLVGNLGARKRRECKPAVARYAAERHSYRWCSPPRRGRATRWVCPSSRRSRGRPAGVDFPRPSCAVVVVGDVVPQQPSEMALTEHDNMDAASLRVAPRRARAPLDLRLRLETHPHAVGAHVPGSDDRPLDLCSGSGRDRVPGRQAPRPADAHKQNSSAGGRALLRSRHRLGDEGEKDYAKDYFVRAVQIAPRSDWGARAQAALGAGQSSRP